MPTINRRIIFFFIKLENLLRSRLIKLFEYFNESYVKFQITLYFFLLISFKLFKRKEFSRITRLKLPRLILKTVSFNWRVYHAT